MRIKNIKYLLGLVGFLLAFSACDVDVQPYNGKSGEDLTPGDLEGMTLGNYRLMKNEGGLVENGYRFAAYGGDELSIVKTTTDALMQLLDYRRNVNSTRMEYAYEFCYRTTVQCNIAIGFAEQLGNARTTRETLFMGENYYLRALCYFMTVNMFAQQYVNNPTQNPGIVLKLSTDINDFPEKRATVAQVYEQIESDLLEAISYMTIPAGDNTKPKSSIYASKEAAEALLARVYLYMENWDKAREYADKVIKSGRYELLTGETYGKYPQHVPESNKETIFAVRKTIDKDRDNSNEPGGMYCRIDNVGWAEIGPSSRYMELLELHPEDLRSSFIAKQYEDTEEKWFIYTRPQAGTIHYQYLNVKVEEQTDGSYKLIGNHNFTSDIVKKENWNLGSRYYVLEKDGTKRTGRIEGIVKQTNDLPQYHILKASYQEQRTQLWSPLVSRLAEMYLIRAEANAMLGQNAPAIEDINTLRRRAGIPEWTQAKINATVKEVKDGVTIYKTIHDVIEEERQLELAFEGHRRFDVFRKKQTLDKRYPGYHTRGAVETVRLEIPWNDPAVCEFLPQRQLDAYPHQLEQNP